MSAPNIISAMDLQDMEFDNIDVESQFRTGYWHGYLAALEHLKEGKTDAQMEQFCWGALRKWYDGDCTADVEPPTLTIE
jgi:hypothetical protein